MGILWILEYLSECQLGVSTKGFSVPEGEGFCPCLSASSNCQTERALIFFFFPLKMAIKREDVTSYCELQTYCLVFLQFPCCLEIIMALQHLLMFGTLLNPQPLKIFERNKYRRNQHPLRSLTPSQSVTSGAWNHSFIGRGDTLQRTRKRNMGLQVRSLHAFDTFSCLKHITLFTSGALTKRGWWYCGR